MQFYTNVSRYGNSILYRGYDHAGKKIIKKISQMKIMKVKMRIKKILISKMKQKPV